jgi:hypothetical protein
MFDPINSFNGYKVVIKHDMLVTELYPRSPSRAKRRAARGFRQHYRKEPDKSIIMDKNNRMIYCHPLVWEELKLAIAEQQKQKQSRIQEMSRSFTLFGGVVP